jgi:hypothetical protein
VGGGGSVEDRHRGRREDRMPIRAQKGRDAHKGMGERGVGLKIAGYGEALKGRVSELPSGVRGLPNRQERTVRQSKGHGWEAFNCRRIPVQPVSAIRGGEGDVVADNLCRDLGGGRLRQKRTDDERGELDQGEKGLKIGFGRGWRGQSVSKVKG